MPCFLVLVLILICLATGGAGVLPYVLQISAVTASMFAAFFSRYIISRQVVFCIALIVGFLTITILPLPPFTDALTGLKRSRQNQLVRQTLADAQKLSLNMPRHQWLAMSRNRAGTMRIILLVALALSTGMLSASLHLAWKRRLLVSLLIIGSIVAAVSVAGIWLWPQGKTLWWLVPVQHGRPMGPFMNRNHCGGFAAMLAPATLTGVCYSVEKRRVFAAIASAISFLLMIVCVVMSLSRGAWLACAAGLVTLSIFFLLNHRLKAMLASLLIILTAAFGVLGFGNKAVVDRASTFGEGLKETTISMRIQTWKDAAAIFLDYPVLGVGANAFRMVFPQYRSASTRPTFKHAENEYIQLPVELGLMGVVLLLVLGTALIKDWQAKSRASVADPLLLPCAVGALTVAATHAVCDFAVRTPLYTTTLAICTALAWPEPLGHESKKPNRPVPVAVFILVITAAISLVGSDVNRADNSDFLSRATKRQLAKFLSWSPTSWQAWYHLGRRMLEENPTVASPLAHHCMTTAAEYDPLNYRLWSELCIFRISLGDYAGAQEAYSRMKSLRTWLRIREME